MIIKQEEGRLSNNAADGSFEIAHLTPGKYKMEIWYELASETELAALAQNVDITSGRAPIAITLHSSDVSAPHFNKYGQEYSPDKPQSY
jgi:hypothetical protein